MFLENLIWDTYIVKESFIETRFYRTMSTSNMADDDEVDILGDFSMSLGDSSNLIGDSSLVSQNSDLLNCDYTIHPQWLLDRPSADPDNWYEGNVCNSNLSDMDIMGHVSTENCITDESGWTEKEKNLLQRGLEIFGKSSVRLSQFIGSKTSSEVKYYLKNFYTGSLNCYQQAVADNSGEDISAQVNLDLIDDNQIPASIEEVIAAVSTGYPTVDSPTNKTSRRRSSSTSMVTSYSPKKVSSTEKVGKVKRKLDGKGQASKKQFKLKFKSDPKQSFVQFKSGPKVEAKKLNYVNSYEETHNIQRSGEKDLSTLKEITTGKGLAVPICEGEEIVTIQHAEDESSDVSIDVEDIQDPLSSNKLETPKETQNDIVKGKTISENGIDFTLKHAEDLVDEDLVDEDISRQLNSLDEPLCELQLDKNVITKLEKYVHSDFFEGKASKTPERYLKIRNHILNNWYSSKPNYIFKTSMRIGLKNCGDVNTISRIHYFLEQIGAVNFGCEQTKYERPLAKIMQISLPSKDKSTKQMKALTSREPTQLGPRQRFKKKFVNDGEGGCTMVHDEKGEIINTTVVNEEPSKSRTYIKKPTIRLIYCRPFTSEKPQEYTVKISLSTLIQMDFHSHLYLNEVMGLIGGSWDYNEGILRISSYEPCNNLASSSTHCDMCPISQARAAENIHSKKFEILGWFHSHPTFAPEPSQQDLDTQQTVQQWIGYGKPCLGVILSPFSGNGALISSPFRCWMVDKKPNFEDQLVPYRFKVDVATDDFNMSRCVEALRKILLRDDETLKDKRIDFCKPYFQDSAISHLDKFISSVNMHLARTGAFPKSAHHEFIQTIQDFITKYS